MQPQALLNNLRALDVISVKSELPGKGARRSRAHINPFRKLIATRCKFIMLVRLIHAKLKNCGHSILYPEVVFCDH